MPRDERQSAWVSPSDEPRLSGGMKDEL